MEAPESRSSPGPSRIIPLVDIADPHGEIPRTLPDGRMHGLALPKQDTRIDQELEHEREVELERACKNLVKQVTADRRAQKLANKLKRGRLHSSTAKTSGVWRTIKGKFTSLFGSHHRGLEEDGNFGRAGEDDAVETREQSRQEHEPGMQTSSSITDKDLLNMQSGTDGARTVPIIHQLLIIELETCGPVPPVNHSGPSRARAKQSRLSAGETCSESRETPRPVDDGVTPGFSGWTKSPSRLFDQ